MGLNPGKSRKFERCVAAVAARDGSVGSPEAVCAASLRRAGWAPRRNVTAFEIWRRRKRGNPNFDSYDEAQDWIASKSEEYGSRNRFLSSAEYKNAHPAIQKLYQASKTAYTEKGSAALREADLKIGDRVFYDSVSPFGVEKYSGVLMGRSGVPRVKLDPGQKTMTGKTSTRWHKGWRRNPASASDLSEAWHGRPVRRKTTVLEEIETPDEFTDLGGLEALWVIDRDSKHARVVKFGHDVRLASNPEGTQLYLVGGDQSLDLDELHIPAKAQARELVEIGPVWKIEYAADKHHLDVKKPESWVHEFGEESGEVPVLVYCRTNERMMLAGGTYQIPVDADRTSPGIVD